MDKYFFEIPVYRKSIDVFHKELDIEKEKYSNYPDPETKKIMEHDWDRRHFRCWKYNDVIGWMRLYFDWYQVIKWYYFQVDAKRMMKWIVKKRFVFQTHKIIELWLPDYEKLTNKDIFESLQIELERLSKVDFKKRYIDLEVFQNIWPYIDWKKFMNDNL